MVLLNDGLISCYNAKYVFSAFRSELMPPDSGSVNLNFVQAGVNVNVE